MFNNEFFGAWKYVPLLTISALFSGYAGFWASFFRASKKTNILLHSTIISAVINIALNSVLIRLCGFSMIESWIIYPLFLVFVAVIFSVYKDKVLKICFMVKKYLRKGDK